jgi:AraC-like DNA-binding protein
MQPPPAGSFIRFSTDGMSDREAIVYWRDFVGAVVVRADFKPVAREGFHQSNTLVVLPGLKIAFGTSTGLEGLRTPALAADGNDDLMFTINLSGGSLVGQRDRELKLGTGQAAMLSFADACSHVFPQPAEYLNFSIPRIALRDHLRDPEDAMMRTLYANNGALRLLTDYVSLVSGKHAPLEADLHRPLADHVIDLVALAVGATRDGAVLAQGRGVRAARLSAIKADAVAHMREESLSVHDVAKRHGVTPRYLQLLFETTGQTFSEFLLEQRLLRARRMLADRAYADWTISAIAFEVGFGNLSWFNRTFRRRYGISPSDIRYAATREG